MPLISTAAVFLRQTHPHKRAGMPDFHCVGLLTYALCVSTQGSVAFPGFPSDRLSPETDPVSIYSGGTVRDLHPIILFSNQNQASWLPRSGLSNCHEYCSTVQSYLSRHTNNYTSSRFGALPKCPLTAASDWAAHPKVVDTAPTLTHAIGNRPLPVSSSRKSPGRRSRRD